MSASSQNYRSYLLKACGLSCLTFICTACSLVFSRTTSSEVVRLPFLEANDGTFEKIAGEYPIYKSKNENYVAAIQECDIPAGKNHSALARARELFVGFSTVKVPKYTNITIGSRQIERAFILAKLDNTPIGVASYLVPGRAGCLYDVVVWQKPDVDGEPDDLVQALENSEKQYQPWLTQVIDSIE